MWQSLEEESADGKGTRWHVQADVREVLGQPQGCARDGGTEQAWLRKGVGDGASREVHQVHHHRDGWVQRGNLPS